MSFKTWGVLAALSFSLVGCAVVTKVDPGKAVVGDRLSLQVTQPWNRFERNLTEATPTWSQHGFTVDALKFYVGIANDKPLAEVQGNPKAAALKFRSSMQETAAIELLQSLLTLDGSTFQLNKVEPHPFAGQKGVRFEFEMARKSDHVQLKGLGYAAIKNGELFMMTYAAPRMSFFDRHSNDIEQMAASAIILK